MRNKKGQFIKGHEVPIEWREKAKENFTGHTRLGSKHTKESNEKNRIAHLGKIAWNKSKFFLKIRGENHWNWKGGISLRDNKSIEYRQWRKQVFEKDNYTCQNCFKKKEVSGKLHAHHLYYYSIFKELRYAVKNGMTLCTNCHAKLHAKNRNIDKIMNEVAMRSKNYGWLLKEYNIVGQNI